MTTVTPPPRERVAIADWIGAAGCGLGLLSILLFWAPFGGVILAALGIGLAVYAGSHALTVGGVQRRTVAAVGFALSVLGFCMGMIATVLWVTAPTELQENHWEGHAHDRAVPALPGSNTNVLRNDPGSDITSDGLFTVGDMITPGVWRSTGPRDPRVPMCFWQRLSNTSGDTRAVLASNLSQGTETVTVAPTDGAFRTAWCSAWTKIG